MSDSTTLVQQIHDSGHTLVLCVTGGGSLAISRLLTVPGASRSVLEATSPYSSAALGLWLGAKPEHYCAADTARLMAMAGFTRAQAFAGGGAKSQEPGVLGGTAGAIERLAGVGCTASLASDRPKRGAHRLHVAAQTVAATVTYSLELEKGARSRLEEESLVADLVLNAIADSAGVPKRIELPLRDVEQVQGRRTEAPEAWQELVFAKGPPVAIGLATRTNVALLPGAFHPVHAGHRGMAEVAASRLKRPVNYELSVENVDKPSLDYTEIEDRLAKFRAEEGVWLTSAPTFLKKARLFPGAVFVVGFDTIVRISEIRYWNNDSAERDAAIAEIAALGCRFLVFGRRRGECFETLPDAQLPSDLLALCDEVPEQEFRLDISSTDLRRTSVVD